MQQGTEFVVIYVATLTILNYESDQLGQGSTAHEHLHAFQSVNFASLIVGAT